MRLECKLCGKRLDISELLSAPSPFDPDDLLQACPQCKQVSDGFDHLCDVSGCNDFVGCGLPLPEKYQKLLGKDYLHTCHKHWIQYKD
jgi:hypothetical protein